MCLRLNLSIFTGRLSETEMLEYHKLEYQHLMIENEQTPVTEEAEIEAG